MIILISFIIYIFKHPEKLDKWSYLYNKYRLFKTERSERKVISKNLDYKITSISKRINNESDGILPFGLRIIWRDVDKIDSYVKSNDVLIVLKKDDVNDKNIINACCAYVPKALLPKSRNCINSKILQSLDHFIIKSILASGTYDSAYNFYIKNIFSELIRNDALFDNYIRNFNKLNEIGIFTRLLLEEYRRLGVKLYGTYQEQNYLQESIEFLYFLELFAARSPGDTTRLIFNGDIIKIGIVLIAKKWTLDTYGINAYFTRIEQFADKGMQRIYVFSYAQRYDEIVTDGSGYVQEVVSRRDFLSLNALEKKCKESQKVRLIKKQIFNSRDSNGAKRTSKYIIYESIQ